MLRHAFTMKLQDYVVISPARLMSASQSFDTDTVSRFAKFRRSLILEHIGKGHASFLGWHNLSS